MARIKDINGNDYIIYDLDNFKDHIVKYHTINGQPDNSIHEENGFNFLINSDFYTKLNELK
tara:strand:+ start:5479 stop:5661 length:183 start_codon:yes stop_codon:yes gene_type:complete